MKILIAGFYGHQNFGDDCFVKVFDRFLSGHQLKYTDIANLDKEDIHLYDCVVIGAGDVLNDFYGLKYNEVLANYRGYKIAVGVGVSFFECAKRSYINYFDDIILRSKEDLPVISKILGTIHTHYLPDLAYSIPISFEHPSYDGARKKIGFYLVGTMIDNPGLLYTIHRFANFVLTTGYELHLIPMHHREGMTSSDVSIGENIANVFKLYESQIKVHPLYDFNTFISIMGQLDFALCARFHAHVFCVRLGVPFISIPLTRKVELLVKELPYDCQYTPNVIKDASYNLLGIDVKDIKSKFNDLVKNASSIRSALLYRADLDHKAFQENKIVTLIQNRRKRTIQPVYNIIVNPEDIYVKYRNMFLLRGVNHLTDKCTDILDEGVINRISDSLCYDITYDTANDYSYGTRENIRNNLAELRGMVYYIYQDYMNKQRVPKINMTYIKQDSFHDLHRAGWQYSIGPLYCYSGDHGVFFDTYLDRTFGWASDVLCENGVLPYTNYWVGFFHHTFELEFSRNSCSIVFDNPVFRASLRMCKGIYCLTRYLAKLVKIKLEELGFGGIPINTLHHPTVFVNNNFNYESFMKNENRKLINVGSWYRNPVTIYRLANNYESSLVTFNSLRGKRMDSNFCPDHVHVRLTTHNLLESKDNIWTQYYIKYINSKSDDYSIKMDSVIRDLLTRDSEVDIRPLLDTFLSKINILSTLSNEEFDNMYVNNIVFLDLVDSSTVNTILEVIVRKTPVVVNRIEPTVELLGESYPLFYDHLDDIPALLTPQKILSAHEYMKTSIDDSVYRIDSFVESLIKSPIYQSL